MSENLHFEISAPLENTRKYKDSRGPGGGVGGPGGGFGGPGGGFFSTGIVPFVIFAF